MDEKSSSAFCGRSTRVLLSIDVGSPAIAAGL